MEMSEILNCTACNDYGCDSVAERVEVLERSNGIVSKPNEILEGYDVTLECTALKDYGSIQPYWDLSFSDARSFLLQGSIFNGFFNFL